MSDLMKFEGVNAYYGAAHILHDFDLVVEEGERVALIGRNGVGKTTVVNALLGVASVGSGTISVAGSAIHRPRPYMAAKRGVMVVPQGRCIIANLTVEENLMLGSAVQRSGPWNLDAVYVLFPILKERARTPGTALSGGQQQMLAVGRALMANPSLLVLDEPTEGLAPVIVDQLGEIFNRLGNEGTALLLIEQNLTLVGRVARRYYAVSKGTVTAEGRVDPDDVLSLEEHVVI